MVWEPSDPVKSPSPWANATTTVRGFSEDPVGEDLELSYDQGMQLFDEQNRSRADVEPTNDTAPLADRLRPLDLDEVVGQVGLLGSDGPLRSLLERETYRSFLFWGPPGTGKTTVGRILAERSNARFVHLSAALSGVKDVRQVLEGSRFRWKTNGKRDLLFLDEIHRFSRSQQDVLLSFLEEGSVIFIGATTENPSFALNSALLSRCQLFCFEPLTEEDLRRLIERALSHPRGLGNRFDLTERAMQALITLADGDARRALTALELAASIAPGRRSMPISCREPFSEKPCVTTEREMSTTTSSPRSTSRYETRIRMPPSTGWPG